MFVRALVVVFYASLCFMAPLAFKSSGAGAEIESERLLSVWILDMKEDRRIAVAVVNVRANNIQLIASVEHAEDVGDAKVVFERSGHFYRRKAMESRLIDEAVEMFPAGTGFVRARRKSEYVAMFGLDQGCYLMRVSYSNAKASTAPVIGPTGPVTKPVLASATVCFDNVDIRDARRLKGER